MNAPAYFLPLGPVDDGDSAGPGGMAASGGEFLRFMPTEHTHGAWGPFQHGSPPAALLTRMLERCSGIPEGTRTTRIAVDLLGAVPYTELRARSWISRPGRQILKVEAELLAEVRGSWRPVASASAWRMAVAETSGIERAFERPIPGPDQAGPDGVPLIDAWGGGYIDSVEAVAAADPDPLPGAGGQAPPVHWVCTRLPVVDGEEPSPVERLMQVVDTANGIGATLDPTEWAFMNTDLVVHLHRVPEFTGDWWLGIAARGSIGPDGIGMTAGELYDARGPIGRSVQTLLVRPQDQP